MEFTGDTAMQRRFAVKYGIDRVVALVALALLAPLLVLIAAAVGLSSRGPVFFRQRRVSLNGRIFELYKFRTMRDRGGHHVRAAAGNRTGRGRRHGSANQAGGWLLRASSLDELPAAAQRPAR